VPPLVYIWLNAASTGTHWRSPNWAEVAWAGWNGYATSSTRGLSPNRSSGSGELGHNNELNAYW